MHDEAEAPTCSSHFSPFLHIFETSMLLLEATLALPEKEIQEESEEDHTWCRTKEEREEKEIRKEKKGLQEAVIKQEKPTNMFYKLYLL